jgi:anti-anti-sigma regulatory factor
MRAWSRHSYRDLSTLRDAEEAIMAIENRDVVASPRCGQPLHGLFSKIRAPRADLSSPIGTADPVTAKAPLCHWHLVGGGWRPLHEQLNALSDAATWARAWAPESSSVPGIAEPVELAEKLSVASVQCGHDYAAVVVSGALDAIAIRQLRACLRGLIEGGTHSLLIDLSQVPEADGRLGLMLHRAETALRIRHGRLVLLNVPPGIRSSLDVGRISQSFASCRGSIAGPAGSTAHPPFAS